MPYAVTSNVRQKKKCIRDMAQDTEGTANRNYNKT